MLVGANEMLVWAGDMSRSAHSQSWAQHAGGHTAHSSQSCKSSIGPVTVSPGRASDCRVVTQSVSYRLNTRTVDSRRGGGIG
jgi:hypothetical protein